jgi:hypothetical protein
MKTCGKHALASNTRTSEREQASYREAQEKERAKAHNRPAKMLKVSNDGEAPFHCC